MILQSLFLSPVDLQKIEGYPYYPSAWRAYQVILSALGKPPGKRFTVEEYCNHERVSKDEVLMKLQTTRLPRTKRYGSDQPQLF
jgi:hypothetical protein